MSITVAERRTMARPKGRPKGNREDVSVKLDKSLVLMAKAIARTLGVSVAEYLSGISSAPINRDYVKMLREAEKKGEADPK